uniref:Uncharacterized protein n=1 Tax=Aegilops tauschii subsp. strangulata TaxID=200361 RepID=A0A453AH62_AEGTS
WRVRPATRRRRRRPPSGTGTGSSATAAASPTSAASSSPPWRTARSRSSGWPRRASSRRAPPASRSGRSLRRWVCRWTLSRSGTRRSRGRRRRPGWSPACWASHLRVLAATVELRERYFGPSYELLSHEKYAEVWAIDEADPFLAPEGGESVADVASRLAGVLFSTDVEFHGSAVLIVSHGDPLQIFQAVLSGAKENPSFLDEVAGLKKESLVVPSVLSQHRKFALNTAELRQVV